MVKIWCSVGNYCVLVDVAMFWVRRLTLSAKKHNLLMREGINVRRLEPQYLHIYLSVFRILSLLLEKEINQIACFELFFEQLIAVKPL